MNQYKLSLVITLFLLCLSLDARAQFAGGSGSASDPYQIETLEHLNEINNHAQGMHFIQIANIHANDKPFIPIGNEESRFTGHYDGDGHAISNLRLGHWIDFDFESDIVDNNYTGLFGFTENATIKNITLDSLRISLSDPAQYVGGMVGFSGDNTIIKNVHVAGRIESVRNHLSLLTEFGGIAGSNHGIIENATFDGSIRSDGNHIGGLSGSNYGTISESSARVFIKAWWAGGGLVGGNHGTIRTSFVQNNSQIEGIEGSTGGLAGYNDGEIMDSYSHADVSVAEGTGGGLTGHNRGSVLRAYTTGMVSGSNYFGTGGLVGSNSGLIEQVYAIGPVNASGPSDGDLVKTGGLVGVNDTDGVVQYGYWNTETTGIQHAVGEDENPGILQEGLTTDQMTGFYALNNMPGFDHSWMATNAYPILYEVIDDFSNPGGKGSNQQITLHQNYPNPFNPVTIINYELEEDSYVLLEIFDILGRNIAVLADQSVSAGTHEAIFDASNLTSGIYIYRLRVRNSEGIPATLTRSMMLIM